MPITLTTKTSKRITVKDVPFASGGEGAVHEITASADYSGHCVKLYSQQFRDGARETKIQFMASNPPPEIKTHLYIICWPLEAVYRNGQFAGFVMPLAYADSLQLYEFCVPRFSKRVPLVWQQTYDRSSSKGVESRFKLCVNIASAISAIHGAGGPGLNAYVLVDLKPQNILVTGDGRVSLIDMDSIQIATALGGVFPAQVATLEYVPAEGNYLNLGKDLIPETWDRFSLAVVLYEVLFGVHPYAASFQGQYQNSNSIAESISNGLFVFGAKRSYVFSKATLHDNFGRIPASLQNLFVRAFDGGPVDTRPNASEWGGTFYGELTNGPTKPGAITRPTQAFQFTAPPPNTPAAKQASAQSLAKPPVRSGRGLVVAICIIFVLILILKACSQGAKSVSMAVGNLLGASNAERVQRCWLSNAAADQTDVNVRVDCDTRDCAQDPLTKAGSLPNNTPVLLYSRRKSASGGRFTWVQIKIEQTGQTVWVASSKLRCE